MKFWLATLTWTAIGAVLGLGIYLMTVKGDPWLFIISTLAFVGVVGRVCATSH